MLDLRSNTIGWAPIWPIQILVPLGAALLLIVSTAQLDVIASGKAPAFFEPPPAKAAPEEAPGRPRGCRDRGAARQHSRQAQLQPRPELHRAAIAQPPRERMYSVLPTP